jgi:hypothetical protein
MDDKLDFDTLRNMARGDVYSQVSLNLYDITLVTLDYPVYVRVGMNTFQHLQGQIYGQIMERIMGSASE